MDHASSGEAMIWSQRGPNLKTFCFVGGGGGGGGPNIYI